MTFKLKILSGLSAIHTSKSTRKINMSKCLCFPWRFLCVLIRWSLNSFSSVGCVHCSLLMISSVVDENYMHRDSWTCFTNSSHERERTAASLIRSLCSYSWFLCFLPINNEHWILPIMLWYPEHTSRLLVVSRWRLVKILGSAAWFAATVAHTLSGWGVLGGDRKWEGFLDLCVWLW